LWKLLKKVWHNGAEPKLQFLRAETHCKIPGSCKNKAVLAIAMLDFLKPEHKWNCWTCWRIRNEDEAAGRYPNKTAKEMCYTQLHCVCKHQQTGLWVDPIRLWDRDPLHKWSVLDAWEPCNGSRKKPHWASEVVIPYPNPKQIPMPTPQTFNLKAHTHWMQAGAAPGGKKGYSCDLDTIGVVPPALASMGVQGDSVGSTDDTEVEEQDDFEE